MQTGDNFETWVPFALVDVAKSLKPGDEGFDPRKHMRVVGLVSTDSTDLHDERVLQDGLDFSQCKWFNDDHIRNTAVGIPERTFFLRKGQRLPDGIEADKTGWYVDGYLLDSKRGLELWDTAKALERSGQRMGFSIQGKSLKRNNTIVKAQVHEIAITTLPVNTDSWLTPSALVKSMMAGHDSNPTGGTPGDGGPLRTESLEGDKSEAPMSEFGKGCKTADEFTADRKSRGMNEAEYETALEKSGMSEAYRGARLESKLEKSLATMSSRVSAVAGTIDAMNEQHAEMAKSLGARAEPGDDIAALTEMVGDLVKSVTALAEQVELNSRATAATAGLVGQVGDMAKSLTDDVGSLREDVSSIGSAPMPRRGATGASAAAAAAAAARAGFQDADGDGKPAGEYNVGVMKKSLLAAYIDADKKDDKQSANRFEHWISMVETGQGAKIAPQMKGQGLAIA